MLKILLSASDGGTTWRHLLRPGEARAGFEAVDPARLAARIGALLGFPAEPVPEPDRLGALAQRLDIHDNGQRSYSASRRADPFGVTRYLLDLRDRLKASGWGGTPLEGSLRLRDLSELETSIPPGLADQWLRLSEAVREVGTLPEPVQIDLVQPLSHFDPALCILLEALQAAGARVHGPPPPVALAPPDSDLGRLQRVLTSQIQSPVRLAGEGSLLVLEADTPLEAAELAASWLGTLTLPDVSVVAGEQAMLLEAALRRRGLPTLGLRSSSVFRPSHQVLPLRLSLAFAPQDPYRAAELLQVPGGPLPGRVRSRLLKALAEMPGIGSPEWVEAVAAEDPGLRGRIDEWFGGPLHEKIPVGEAARLCGQVAAWCRARSAGALDDREEPTDEAPLWAHAGSVAEGLRRLLLSRPADERLSERELLQLHDLVLGAGADVEAFPGESGRPAVTRHAASVLAASAGVLWWGPAGEGAAPDPWTEGERAALVAAGLALSAPGERRAAEAAGWRRPVLQAREWMALVTWRLDGVDLARPHPFLDEWEGLLEPGWRGACTVSSADLLRGVARGATWAPRTSTPAPSAPMLQKPLWTLPAAALPLPRELSYSRLESFLGCPFQWVLKDPAGLKPGRAVSLPSGNTLVGSFAHGILQDLLTGPEKIDVDAATREQVRHRAEELFRKRAPLEAAPLVRPGAEVKAEQVRSLIAHAAWDLVRLLRQGGWRPLAAEHSVKGTFAGRPAVGSVDLLLEKGKVLGLLDLKRGWGEGRREELAEGRALQLALYARMAAPSGSGPDLPPTGYFILEDGRILTADAGAFPGALEVRGLGSEATLAAAENGFRAWEAVLVQGRVPVPHPDLPWREGLPAPDPGMSDPVPPCHFCDFRAVCRLTEAPGAEGDE